MTGTVMAFRRQFEEFTKHVYITGVETGRHSRRTTFSNTARAASFRNRGSVLPPMCELRSQFDLWGPEHDQTHLLSIHTVEQRSLYQWNSSCPDRTFANFHRLRDAECSVYHPARRHSFLLSRPTPCERLAAGTQQRERL